MGCRESKSELMKKDQAITFSDPVVSVSSIDMSDEHFSQHQKTILRETWKLIDKENHGISIFILIFERKPEAKELFPFAGLSGDDLLHNSTFRAHAKRFMHVIGTTIENLDALEVALIPILYRLGETHGWIRGFQEHFLPVFIDAILHVITQELGEKCDNDVCDTWTRLGDFLSEELNKGYKDYLDKASADGGDNDPK